LTAALLHRFPTSMAPGVRDGRAQRGGRLCEACTERHSPTRREDYEERTTGSRATVPCLLTTATAARDSACASSSRLDGTSSDRHLLKQLDERFASATSAAQQSPAGNDDLHARLVDGWLKPEAAV
jgi:hypothetical protein